MRARGPSESSSATRTVCEAWIDQGFNDTSSRTVLALGANSGQEVARSRAETLEGDVARSNPCHALSARSIVSFIKLLLVPASKTTIKGSYKRTRRTHCSANS